MIEPRSTLEVIEERQRCARIRLADFDPHDTCVPQNGHWPVRTGQFGASYTSATWIPTGFLVVSGDASAVTFGRFVGTTPEHMLGLVATANVNNVARYAARAMNNSLAYEVDESAALAGLLRLEAERDETPGEHAAEEYGWLSRAIERIRKQHSTAEREIADVERNTGWNLGGLGEVPSRRVIFAHEFCRRLVAYFAEQVREEERDAARRAESREHRAKSVSSRSGLRLVPTEG